MTAVSADQVTLELEGVRILDQVSLSAQAGGICAVVGGDGAGKTSLLRVLIGRILPTSGSVVHPDRHRIGYQPSGSGTWPTLTVAENLDFVAAAYQLRGAAWRSRRDELIDRAGLGAATDRLATHLSGGMRQKLGVIMALAHEPELLVLDEPTTGVDPVSRVELWRMTADAAAAGATVVLATTYLDEAERCQQLLVLDRGRPLLAGTPDEVLAADVGTVTVADDLADPAVSWRRGSVEHTWHPGAATAGETPVVRDIEDTVIAATLSAERAGSAAAITTQPARSVAEIAPTPPTAAPRVDAPLVGCTSVTKSFGDLRAVDAVTLTVAPGQIVGLVGPNGAGKTTLMRLILGLAVADSGDLAVFGGPVDRTARRRIGYVPQGLGLWPDLTEEENATFVCGVYGVTPPAVSTDRRTVAEIGLGNQRRLAFDLALAHNPELLVLDEPTSGVDPLARAALWRRIHDAAERGAGVIVSTHYMQEAEQCDSLVVMDQGAVVATGDASSITAGTIVTAVTCDDWTAAFAALDASHIAVSLAGRRVRAAGAEPAQVAAALASAGVTGEVTQVPATLDETLAVLVRDRTAA